MAISKEHLRASNERLRAVVEGSGLTLAEVAQRTGVDPKTLERWLAGRVPHPRNRHALAAALGVHVIDIWPNADPLERSGSRDLAGVEAVYASRSDFLSARSPGQLFADATSIAMAGLSNNVICQQYADQRLEKLIMDGTSVSCLFLDPKGEAMVAREAEERYDRERGHLAALTSFNISLLQRLRDRLPQDSRDRLRLATYDQTLRFNIIIVDRAADDSTAVVEPYLPHSRGVESPTLVVRPTAEAGLFDTFKKVLDDLTAEAVPC